MPGDEEYQSSCLACEVICGLDRIGNNESSLVFTHKGFVDKCISLGNAVSVCVLFSYRLGTKSSPEVY